MSILTNTDVVPPRLRAIYTLLETENDPVPRADIEALCMPATLFDGAESVDRKMVKSNIKEGLEVGLFSAPSEESLALADDVPRGDFRRAITDRIFGGGERNFDLLRLIAWHLTIDPLNPPKNWEGMENQQVEQLRSVNLIDVAMNPTKLNQFTPWVRFLGFAWFQNLGGEKVLVPDPTEYLRNLLPGLLGKKTGEELPLGGVLRSAAEVCPVIEGGVVRRGLDAAIELLEPNHLSRSSAQAWLRLADAGYLKLTNRSDTEVFIFPDADTDRRYSHLVW